MKKTYIGNKIEFGIIKEGEHTVIKHTSGHNVPKLIDEQMDKFIDFIEKAYYQKFGEQMRSRIVVDESYKNNYLMAQKTKNIISKL